jgi:hypothetical protein
MQWDPLWETHWVDLEVVLLVPLVPLAPGLSRVSLSVPWWENQSYVLKTFSSWHGKLFPCQGDNRRLPCRDMFDAREAAWWLIYGRRPFHS